MERRLCRLYVDSQLLSALLCPDGQAQYQARAELTLPADVQVVGVAQDLTRAGVVVFLQSAAFDVVPDGAALIELRPLLRSEKQEDPSGT